MTVFADWTNILASLFPLRRLWLDLVLKEVIHLEAPVKIFPEVVKQFLKDADKAPGWFPLFLFVLAASDYLGMPEQVHFLGKTISAEVAGGIITFVLYNIGDALDEWIFKEPLNGKTSTRKVYKKYYSSAQRDVRSALDTGEDGL